MPRDTALKAASLSNNKIDEIHHKMILQEKIRNEQILDMQEDRKEKHSNLKSFTHAP